MKKQFKLGVIGCGFMAQVLIKGVVLSDFLREKRIIVSDTSEEKLKEVVNLGVRTTSDNGFVAENSEYLIIDVQPRDFERVVASLKGYSPEKVISLVSGYTKNTVKNALGPGVKVARCIPNLPCAIGSGAIGVDMLDFNGLYDDTEFIVNVFNCVGTVISIDESKMSAAEGISGCGPAYAFMLIDSLIDAGIKQGLARYEAKILAVQTVLGAAEMLQDDKNSVPDLLKRVCSDGGAAIEAVKVLEDKNFRGIISEAVAACVKRSEGISGK